MREDKRGEERGGKVMRSIKSSLSKKQNRNIRLSEDRVELLETIKELVKREVQKSLKEMNLQNLTYEDKGNSSASIKKEA